VVFDCDRNWFRSLGEWLTESDINIRFLYPHFNVFGLLTFSSISFRSKVIQYFRFGLKLLCGLKFWLVLGILDF
jgi:hypothetical protein